MKKIWALMLLIPSALLPGCATARHSEADHPALAARSAAAPTVRYHHELISEPGEGATQFLHLVPETD